MGIKKRLYRLKDERIPRSSRREPIDYSTKELISSAITGLHILQSILQVQVTSDVEDLHDMEVGINKVRVVISEMASRLDKATRKQKNAENKKEEAIMPAGKGTYGTKRGRPPKKKKPVKKTPKK